MLYSWNLHKFVNQPYLNLKNPCPPNKKVFLSPLPPFSSPPSAFLLHNDLKDHWDSVKIKHVIASKVSDQTSSFDHIPVS